MHVCIAPSKVNVKMRGEWARNKGNLMDSGLGTGGEKGELLPS